MALRSRSTFLGVDRLFPVPIDAKYDVVSTVPRSEFTAKAFRTVAEVLVAPDGTGDFESIQEAINALPSTGGTVFIKAGVYLITATITFDKGSVTLSGAGKASEIRLNTSLAEGSALISVATNDAITIENLFINGNSQNTSITGIKVGQAQDTIIRGCFIQNCTDTGIIASATTEADLFTLISGNLISANGIGILMTRMSKSIISGNHVFSQLNGGGILVEFSNEVLVSNNISADNGDTLTDHGIELQESFNCIISNNICIGNSDAGIQLIGHAVTADTCSDNIISNNRCTGNDSGIVIDDARCKDNLVHGNQLLNNTSAAFTDNGTGTTLADNVTI